MSRQTASVFAYRRFGKPGALPLVFNQHYTGTMDYWDPAVTDGLAKNREVILFNNAGVSSSSGEVPATFQEMGANAIAFINALDLKKIDLLGFSIGGLGRAGDHPAGARTGAPLDPGRDRAAGWGSHVAHDQRSRQDFQRHLRSTRGALVGRAFFTLSIQPGGRP